MENKNWGKYKLSVPVTNLLFINGEYREKTVGVLKNCGAERVFLALGADSMLNGKKEEELRALKENSAYLHSLGFETGAWFWAFYTKTETGFTRMKSPSGAQSKLTVCPTDGRYRELMADFVAEAGACGVDLIMFDDDLRYGFQDMGFGCVCENHISMMEGFLGEKIDPGLLTRSLLSGEDRRYRSALRRANGDALLRFAADMREALNKTAPSVRLGFCSCITSWDIDGTTPDALSKVLAGNTRPFYRLIGAPYWAAMRAWGNRLCDVIELERAEAARRRDGDTEIFSEGDTYPRPRFATPASYLECFDTAMRASGCTDGILKYMLDYTSGADYETGYYEAHIGNMEVYSEIDRVFAGKKDAGVRVYDAPEKYETFEFPSDTDIGEKVQDLAFSAASRFITANSIPSVYSGTGCCGIAFGEDCRRLPPEAYGKGLIIDADAASILSSQGIDVGLLSAGESFPVSEERFIIENERVALFGSPRARKLVLSERAAVLSEAKTPEGETFPLSYTYRVNGRRFLVYAFPGFFNEQNWFRGYLRAAQIRDFAENTGDPLPACCPGHPELYILVKEKDGRTAVGLWNLFADAVIKPVITFPENVKLLSCVKCEAKAQANTVCFSTDIPAFDFAFFEAEKTDAPIV